MERLARVFVAVGLPPGVRMRIADSLAGVDLPGSVVTPENWHVTVRFIGDTDIVSFERLVGGLDESLPRLPFQIRLGRMGAFPHARRAAVLWYEATSDRLTELRAVVEDVCERVGLGREDRPFRPHLTMARVRPPTDVRGLLDRIPPLDLVSSVTELMVLRSVLDDGPTRYEVLERFPLGEGRRNTAHEQMFD